MQRYYILVLSFFLVSWLTAQDQHNHSQATASDTTHHATAEHSADTTHHEGGVCGGHSEHNAEYDTGSTAFHHIADANIYSIGPFNIPLPCITYVPTEGWSFFSSSVFGIGHHGDGHKAVNGFVLDGGALKRVNDPTFPKETVEIGGFSHSKDEKDKHLTFVCYQGNAYAAESPSSLDGGLFGGGITSFYDFSITKNVMSMFIVFGILLAIFASVKNAYTKRKGMAPTGLQNLMETLICFIRDEVAKPFLGHHWAKYMPYLLSLFFFILGLNIFGQIPFFGGSNVTGNIAVTAALAIIAFFVTNLNGNAHYWKHLFTAPGIPFGIKLIIVPIELLGLIIKPLTLTLRLFANITAGHMVIMIFIGFIFLFGKSGENPTAAYSASIGSTLLTLFMMTIELIVAFVQAFVFTILTASYIGAATEEAHH